MILYHHNPDGFKMYKMLNFHLTERYHSLCCIDLFLWDIKVNKRA